MQERPLRAVAHEFEARLVARGDTDDPRRVYYRLTALGQTTLRAETERLSRVARVARRQLGSA